MKIFKNIVGYTLALLILMQSMQLAIVSYLYHNHNQLLVENYCVNKKTDSCCKAKCLLNKTQKEQKNSNQELSKKIEFIPNGNLPLQIDKMRLIVFLESKTPDFYQNFYQHLTFLEIEKPPISA